MFLSICQSFLIALSKWMKNWDDKINNHGHNKLLKDGRKNIPPGASPPPPFLCSFSFWVANKALIGASSLTPTPGIVWIKLIACSIKPSLKAKITKSFWICILMMALPMSVAPKNVQNGTRKWPHVIPARSNKGLGMEAQRRMPMNPTFCTAHCTLYFHLSTVVIVSGFFSFS